MNQSCNVVKNFAVKRLFMLIAGLALAGSLQAQTFDVVYYQVEGKYNSGQYAECLHLKPSVLQLIPELADSSSANVLFYLADSHFQVGETDSALAYYLREVKLREVLKDKYYDQYSNSMYNLALVYNQLGRYSDAQRTAQQVMASDKVAFGGTSDAYLESALFYFDILANQGAYQKAATETVAFLKNLDPSHPLYCRFLAKHADQLAAQGKYAASEHEFGRALAILKNEGDRRLEEATIRVNFAALYADKGMLIEAEELFSQGLKVLQAEGTPENQERYFATLNNYAIVLLALSRLEEAKATYERVLAHDRKMYGKSHPMYGIALNNAGLAYSDMADYGTAERLLREALAIQEAENKNAWEYGSYSNNLGKVLYLQNLSREAIPYLERAQQVFANDPGKESAEYATVLHNLGVAYLMLKNKKALEYLNESVRLRTRLLSAAHPRVGQSYFKLATYQWMVHNTKGAQQQFQATFANYQEQINRYFPGLSESEKSKFYYGNLRPAFEIYSSFVQQYRVQQPELTATLYDLQLRTKGIIFYATQRVRQAIQRSQDANLIAQYETWLELKEQVSSRYSKGDDGKLDSLETLSNNLEKELTRRSAAFGAALAPAPTSWKQVQEKLKPDEAAVEIIRFREYSPDSGGYFTGKVQYAALLVTKTTKHPQWISFPNVGNVMEKRNLNFYRNSIRFRLRDTLSYKVYWSALQPALKNIKRVFVSPDGIYHQINLNTIQNPATSKFLFEEIELENLTNTKDLVTTAGVSAGSGKFMLVGFPQFTGNKKESSEPPAEQVNRGTRAGILRVFRGGEITPLPGTQVEVSEIEQLLTQNKVSVTPRTGTDAHEAAIKAAGAPKVLHLATHGFFLDDPDLGDAENASKYIENPLLRSGLILAGAEDFINLGQNSAEPTQDGILTAQEVMNLDLSGTELVTLSACETGLGTIQNGEGVYGLKRAFAIAGAEKVIMSLWSVDDEATQKLMTLFYQFWVAGSSKEDAFRKAQTELRQQFPDPFYWGAFVMIGQ